MKIVIVDTTNHASMVGGGHLFLPGLMEELTKKGHEVHLVIHNSPNEKIASEIHASGAIVHKRPWGKAGLIEETATRFSDWVNNLQPDMYLISASYDIGWVALPLIHPGIATGTIGHNDSETFYLPVRHYHPYLTMAIGVSHVICKNYINDCHMEPASVEWVPYGVETSKTPPGNNPMGELKIVFVGRIEEEQKRISDIITIVKSLSGKKENFKITIAGDGPDMPGLKSKLENEINDGKVTLTGWLSKTEVINLLRQSQVFLMTSSYEGLSIALIESMANGCCPVVTDIRSGNNQLIKDAVNGFLIEIGDTHAFTEKLTYLANNPEQLAAMRHEAWSKGKLFNTESMVTQYEKNFLKAIDRVHSSPRQTGSVFPLMSSTRSKYPDWIRRLKLLVKGNS